MTTTFTGTLGLTGWLLLALTACGGSGGTDTQPTAPAPGSSGTTATQPSGATAAAGATGRAAAGSGMPSTAASGTSAPAGSPAASSGQAGTAATASAAGSGGQTPNANAGAGANASAGASGSGAADPNAGAGGASAAAGSAAPSGDCDRACLMGFMQKYLDAVIAHDPAMVPISPSAKVTDNGMTAKVGDGIWKTATAIDEGKRLDFADPVLKNVVTHSLINAGSTPIMYLARLKVEGQQIVEIETMTVDQSNAWIFFDPEGLKPEPIFLEMPDPAKRLSRDALMKHTQDYLDYLEGKKSGSEVAFDAMCKRYENGTVTASGSAFNTQSWSFEVTRRVLVIDEEAGITFGMFPFMQSATALVVGEAFKVTDDKIKMIQAIMMQMPTDAWPE